MKKTLLLTALLLALTASIALAGGVNIAWGTLCWTENPTNLKTFACNVNTSTAAFQYPMQLSFAVGADVPDMVALEGHVEGQSALATIPDYWKVGPAPDCRPNMMAFSLDPSLVNADATCADWTGTNQSFPLIGYTWDTNRSHVIIGVAISAGAPQPLVAEQEYYAGQLLFKNSKAVGAGSCSGCSSPFILGFYSIILSLLSGDTVTLQDPLGGEQVGNQCVRWNDPTSSLLCGLPVPAKSTTWGAVKSLYR